MIIYLDENMPPHLAEGFHILQYPEGLKTGFEIDVKYIPAEFKSGVKDVDWIPLAGDQNACVITQDINIHRRKHELQLYRLHGLGMFFLKGISKKQGLSIWDMVSAMAKHWPEICKMACKQSRPFAFEFSVKGKLRNLDEKK